MLPSCPLSEERKTGAGRTPRDEGAWEDFTSSRIHAGQSRDRARGTGLSSSEAHRFHLLIAFLFLGGLLMIFDAIGVVTPTPRPLAPGELDLAGIWRIRFADDPAFASPQLDDSAWCLIRAPDPRVPLPQAAAPSADCPGEAYPVERMRGATYWYRREVTIEGPTGWSEPALFLGRVETRARVYWDGDYVGSARREMVPVALPLTSEQVAPGTHTIAVRVVSTHAERPGLVHDYARGLALGEFSNGVPTGTDTSRAGLVAAMLAALLLVVVFSLLVFLTIQTRGTRFDYSWLALFFGSTSIYAIQRLAAEPLAWYLRDLSLAGWSCALVGLGLDWYPWGVRLRDALARVAGGLWVALTLAFTYAFEFDALGRPWLTAVRVATASLPLVVYASSLLLTLARHVVGGETANRPTRARLTMLLVVLLLYGVNLVELQSLLPLPRLLRSPLAAPLMSCLVFYLAVDAYAEALRSLAFYGRFIRPGLKELLQEKREALYADQKLFRGRRAAVMKVDVANYTRTCYDMPYGVRRLFVDLWYTLIDQVVAEHVFFNKNLGDGSLYCFRREGALGPCSRALGSALRIRDVKLGEFDALFRERLAQLQRASPGLAAPMQRFEAGYRERVGEDFGARRTQIRIALTTGHLDEGLWGLESQSHYDVQGAALILAARIEARAENGEILFDENFLDELEREAPGAIDRAQLVSRRVELRGIGEVSLYGLPPGRDAGWGAALGGRG